MKPEIARGLAIRLNDILKDWDVYGYADILDAYDNSEELFLESLAKLIVESPESVMDDMLNTMNDMLDCIS